MKGRIQDVNYVIDRVRFLRRAIEPHRPPAASIPQVFVALLDGARHSIPSRLIGKSEDFITLWQPGDLAFPLVVAQAVDAGPRGVVRGIGIILVPAPGAVGSLGG